MTLVHFIYRVNISPSWLSGISRIIIGNTPTPTPIQVIDLNNKDEAKAHDRLAAISAELRPCILNLHQSKSEHERRALDRQISHDKAEINKIVFQLYKLSDEDIGLIEGNPLTTVAAEAAPAQLLQSAR